MRTRAKEQITVRCPSCGEKKSIPNTLLGRRLRCTTCKGILQLSSGKPRKALPATPRKALPAKIKAPTICLIWGILWVIFSGFTLLLRSRELMDALGDSASAAIPVAQCLAALFCLNIGYGLIRAHRLTVYMYALLGTVVIGILSASSLEMMQVDPILFSAKSLFATVLFLPPLVSAHRNWSRFQ